MIPPSPVQRIMALSHEVAALQGDISAERDAVLSDLPSTCFFATFRSQQAAAIASQVGARRVPRGVQSRLRPCDIDEKLARSLLAVY